MKKEKKNYTYHGINEKGRNVSNIKMESPHTPFLPSPIPPLVPTPRPPPLPSPVSLPHLPSSSIQRPNSAFHLDLDTIHTQAKKELRDGERIEPENQTKNSASRGEFPAKAA